MVLLIKYSLLLLFVIIFTNGEKDEDTILKNVNEQIIPNTDEKMQNDPQFQMPSIRFDGGVKTSSGGGGSMQFGGGINTPSFKGVQPSGNVVELNANTHGGGRQSFQMGSGMKSQDTNYVKSKTNYNSPIHQIEPLVVKSSAYKSDGMQPHSTNYKYQSGTGMGGGYGAGSAGYGGGSGGGTFEFPSGTNIQPGGSSHYQSVPGGNAQFQSSSGLKMKPSSGKTFQYNYGSPSSSGGLQPGGGMYFETEPGKSYELKTGSGNAPTQHQYNMNHFGVNIPTFQPSVGGSHTSKGMQSPGIVSGTVGSGINSPNFKGGGSYNIKPLSGTVGTGTNLPNFQGNFNLPSGSFGSDLNLPSVQGGDQLNLPSFKGSYNMPLGTVGTGMNLPNFQLPSGNVGGQVNLPNFKGGYNMPSGTVGTGMNLPKFELPSGNVGGQVNLPNFQGGYNMPSGTVGTGMNLPNFELPSGNVGGQVNLPNFQGGYNMPSGTAGTGMNLPNFQLPSGNVGVQGNLPNFQGGNFNLPSGSVGGNINLPNIQSGGSVSMKTPTMPSFGSQVPNTQYGGNLNPIKVEGIKPHSQVSLGSGLKTHDCSVPPKEPLNASMRCGRNSQTCQAICNPNYKFPNGVTSLYITCSDGEWSIKGLELDEIPSCEPICLPQCQNNGICVKPGECSCPDNYSGPQCQHQSTCLAKPPLPRNSKQKCTQSSCTVSCSKGHRFPDGTSITNLICKNGQWVTNKPEWAVVPDCQATCTPECMNGGNCLSYNVCQCPTKFRGPQCQYNVEECAPSKMKFNGAYNCNGTEDKLQCSISCPEGVRFIFPPAPKYTCEYSKGVFVPTNIPLCVYTSDMEVIDGGSSSNSFYTKSNHSVSGGKNNKDKSGGVYYQEYDDGDDYEDEDEIHITRTRKQKSKKWRKKMGIPYYEFDDDTDFGQVQLPGIYSFYTSNDLDVVHRQPQPAICSTWNGNKIKTFDGLTYSAQLYCSHTLVQDRIDGSFSVVLRACPYGAQQPCPHSLDIFLQSEKYSFVNENGLVKLYSTKKQLPIPAQLSGLRVNMVGHNVKISLETIQATILWNSKKQVSVQATRALWNRTAGLCGTMDNTMENDFVSKTGALLKLPNTFIDAWKLPNLDNDPNCIMEHPEEYKEKLCNPDVKLKAANICKKLLNSQKLSNCVKKFEKNSLIASCMSDYCNCIYDNNEKCACESISVMAKDCVFQGVVLNSEWRDLEICPIPCNNGRIYKSCGPSFEPSCGSAIEVADESCQEGCYCPEGTIQHEGVCIQPKACPCSLRGKVFKAGSQITRDCNTCTCEKGNWKCTDATCGARCGAIGDPHYQTFDGKRYDFMGKCSYYLLKTNNFTIEAENVACPGSISEGMGFAPSVASDMPSCTKSVTISLNDGGKVQTIKLKQGRQVLVDGLEITKLPKKLQNGYIKIRQASSLMISVEFQDGIKIWWDGMTRVYIDAPSSYRGKTKGLCGTFNSNLQDDFLTPEGDIETSIEPFADKWRTRESCEFLADSPKVPHPCQLNMENKPKAESICSKLKSKIFEDCHWSVDPLPFYEDCLYDVCACKGDIGQCMCPILAAYGTECARQGVITNWRYSVNECAIKCTPGQVYEQCGDACSRTCEDVQENSVCKSGCVEGCRCPPGQVLDESNECIPISSCPCTYKNLFFNPGYKEVRPGTKFLELCTCVGANWKCKEALEGDAEKFPSAGNIKTKCRLTDNEVFTTCEPSEIVTCKNMHLHIEPTSTAECRPGCVCKKGYVFDVSRKLCVLPNDCSCHHGGRSYNDGDKIREDCNTCSCKSGKWDCTTRQCATTCTAWGDSHFETYDGKDFDFQGVCNYVLSKGALQGGEGFSVTLQNVLCGSLGVTCSKSVQVSILGPYAETITLSADSPIPGIKTLSEPTKTIQKNKVNKLSVHRAGIFIVVEAPGLGFQVKWDRGTRVYVKLENKWKGRVQGLCGNYNGDANDDMKTPSGGVETSPAIFGHSWKLQDFCAVPTEQIDSCAEHPQRKTWAQRKCGILKSDIFKACHFEVPVEKYLKRCIYDTCACDQGGDCDCLCTALAAYAHICTTKGVQIKWRTPDLCPMQCDPHCSSYSSCVSTCPVETCDNILDQGKEQRMCKEDTCVEGCQLKTCPDKTIYFNETFSECVPMSICKPICLEINGVVYYEGDVIKSDNCSSCRCTRGKEICSGVPCQSETKPSTTPITMLEQKLKCTSGWSSWINQDKSDIVELQYTKTKAKGLKNGDLEPVPNFLSLNNINGFAFCSEKYLTAIECRTVGIHTSPKSTGEDVECSLEKGLICNGQCHDYEIRVLCDCGDETTTVKPKPKILTAGPIKIVESTTVKFVFEGKCEPNDHIEFPGNCYKFLHCTITPSGTWENVEKICGPGTMFNPIAKVCDWEASVLAIKPQCGLVVVPTTTKPRILTAGPVKIVESTTAKYVSEGKCEPNDHIEFPGDCHKFLHCTITPSGTWENVEKICGPGTMFNPSAKVCDWEGSVLAIKPQCGLAVIPITTKPLTSNQTTKHPEACLPGQIWSKCAIPCGHACHYYGTWLIQQGFCNKYSTNCIEGCVDANLLLICPPGYVKRDNDQCVAISDCTCRSKSGQMLRPSEVVQQGPCKKCTCIDNSYVCSKIDCEEEEEEEEDEEELNLLGEHMAGMVGIRTTKRPKITTIILPATVTPPPKCDPTDFIPLIDGEYPLSDEAFTASSIYGSSFKPQYSKINSFATADSGGSWSPLYNSVDEHLQITFPKSVPVFGVVMKGSPIYDQFVTSYKVLYSHDGGTFHYVVDEYKRPQVFSGSIDSRLPVQSVFKIPIEAKVVRIAPVTWHESIAVRVELLGCSHVTTTAAMIATTTRKPKSDRAHKVLPYAATGKLTTPAPLSTTTMLTEEHIEPMCDDPMGVANAQLSPSQIKVSSVKPSPLKIRGKPTAPFESLKLNSTKGWKPVIDSPNEFVMFDFLEKRNLTGVKTKGGDTGFVTAYNVLYSPDNLVWNKVQEPNREPKIFIANVDATTPKVNYFKLPIQARYLKIVPIKWQGAIEMKIEPIGCFVKYPPIKKPVNGTIGSPIEEVYGCGICTGVLAPIMPVAGVCKCHEPLYWNGQECIIQSQCPCMVGHMPYDVGTHFEIEDCSECTCLIGGIKQCKPQKCPPCKEGLRAVKSATCMCLCEPCPEFQVLCPSSGACILEDQWCDDIQDCPDDEIHCDFEKPNITSSLDNKLVIKKTCPDPLCGPGLRVKISKTKTTPKMSPMFQEQTNVKTTMKTSYTRPSTKSRNSYDNSLPMPTKGREIKPIEESCVKFVCIPEKPTYAGPAGKITLCKKPVCPEGYEVVIEPTKTSPNECEKYSCEPLPQNDGVCNVTGRTFNTFDGTEFKYDICSHVLARDLTTDKWSVILKKNCSAGNYICTKELEIRDKVSDFKIILQSDLTILWDGYRYTIGQLQKSPMLRKLVTISKNGNTIVFISNVHGFWLTFNEYGDVKIGVSSKYIKTVDGLCGFYNGISADDKRLPTGVEAKSTVEFGDGWYIDEVSKDNCEPHACPKDIQDAAFEMCNAVKDQVFAACKSVVDVERFISKCLETACECVKGYLGDEPVLGPLRNLPEVKNCKCSMLQNFVVECMAANDNIHLDTWRSFEGCDTYCTAPLVHKDCYRRRCEPSCDSLSNDECPFLPGTCFSGCYCPEGTVRKGSVCAPVSECRDCVCDGFGKSQYVTYDRNNFTFDGNCTYLLSRDLRVHDVHTFQVYTSLGACDVAPSQYIKTKTKSGSCTKSLHILYGPHIIHIQRGKGKKLDILVDGVQPKSLPLKEKWIHVTEVQALEIKILLPESQVEITSMFEDMAFSIRVPSVKYGSKMEGLCGDCNKDKSNDFTPNYEKLARFKKTNNSLNDFVKSWLADEPKLELNDEECITEEEAESDCIPLPPEDDPCFKMLDENIFGTCHMLIDPIMYVSACQTDMCKSGSDQLGACESISAYVRECTSSGLCIDWRKNGLCPYNCPSNLTYSPCGCPETCESVKAKESLVTKSFSTKTAIKKQVNECNVPKTEGCFCPPGKLLRNGKCIPERECKACDEDGHFPGDQWYPDICIDCQCELDGKTLCIEKNCPVDDVICERGFNPLEISKPDECCAKFVCVPVPTEPPTLICADTIIPDCGPGQHNKMELDANNCRKYICECIPISECEEVMKFPLPLDPGMKVLTDLSGCCPITSLICDKTSCPPKLKVCAEEFYEVVKIESNDEDQCCEEYKCVAPKGKCIVKIDGKKYLKSPGEKWPTNNPCLTKECSFDLKGTLLEKEILEICDVKCEPGFELQVPLGKCCGKCVQVQCKIGDDLYLPGKVWFGKDNCTKFTCTKKDNDYYISSTEMVCPDVTDCPPAQRYKKGCCTQCKFVAQNKTNCAAEPLTPTQTIGLIKKTLPYYGFCKNSQAIAGFTECRGACASGSKFNSETFQYEKHCDCCTVKEFKEIPVLLLCADTRSFNYTISVPALCSCNPCEEKKSSTYTKTKTVKN